VVAVVVGAAWEFVGARVVEVVVAGSVVGVLVDVVGRTVVVVVEVVVA
jgi:hypothetical protein